jgi:hypothetical protein
MNDEIENPGTAAPDPDPGPAHTPGATPIEEAIGGDPLGDVPMIFQVGPEGAPVYPIFESREKAPRFDRAFQFGPDTLRGLGRAMLDIKNELVLRGYHIELALAAYKPPTIATPPGVESDRHEARLRLRFRVCGNPAEELLLFHELGVISAAHQWARARVGEPPKKLILLDALDS